MTEPEIDLRNVDADTARQLAVQFSLLSRAAEIALQEKEEYEKWLLAHEDDLMQAMDTAPQGPVFWAHLAIVHGEICTGLFTATTVLDADGWPAVLYTHVSTEKAFVQGNGLGVILSWEELTPIPNTILDKIADGSGDLQALKDAIRAAADRGLHTSPAPTQD